jgi:excisionase family DNA binding protein
MSFEAFGLSPQEAAAIVGCHEDTLKRWARTGKIPAFRTPGGWWRFRRSDIEAFLNTRPAVLNVHRPEVKSPGGGTR